MNDKDHCVNHKCLGVRQSTTRAYEKFSNIYMSGNTGKIRTKLFNTI